MAESGRSWPDFMYDHFRIIIFLAFLTVFTIFGSSFYLNRPIQFGSFGPIGFGAAIANSESTECNLKDGFFQIYNEHDFRSCIVGKYIIRTDGSTIKMNEDGTYSGNFRGTSPVGLWSWTDESGFCRYLEIGETKFPRLCGVFSVSTDTVRFRHPTGNNEDWNFVN